MLTPFLKRKDNVPIYKQIVNHIINLAEKNILQPGDVLPPSRQLAQKLSISRYTVTQAYEELWAKGYLESSQGAYTKIRKRPSISRIENRNKNRIDFSSLIPDEKKDILDSLTYSNDGNVYKNKIIDFSVMNLDSSLFPVENFRKSMNEILRKFDPDILNYGNNRGFTQLREWISKRMQFYSIDVTTDEILLTNGISQGLDLLLKLFTERGDIVLTESPGYRIAISLMKFHGLNVIGIPVKEDGMDLKFLRDVLEKLIKNERTAKLIYTVPTFHNPTGITTGQRHREKLLELCYEFSLPIIEDSFEEEINYFDKMVLPIKSMDESQIVFYLGTFSKILFPGLRTGWIAGEKSCIKKLTTIKQISNLSGNPLNHAALFEYCKSGQYETFIKKANKFYSYKMSMAISFMKKYIKNPEIEWAEPSGGYIFWIKTKIDRSHEKELLNICEKNGVKVAAGSDFFIQKPKNTYIRICISSIAENEIEDGISRLSVALNEFLVKHS